MSHPFFFDFSFHTNRRQLFYCNTNGYTGIGWVVGDGTFAALSPRLTLTAYRKANVNTGTTVTIWGER